MMGGKRRSFDCASCGSSAQDAPRSFVESYEIEMRIRQKKPSLLPNSTELSSAIPWPISRISILFMAALRERWFCAYIVASRNHVLYIGVTGDLVRRIHQHKSGTYAGFSSEYRCNRLVWFERHPDPSAAIQREKQLKGWRREKKIALIESANRTWVDLSESWSMEAPSLPRSS